MISYDPPQAAVPTDWKFMFQEEERSTLEPEEQELYIAKSLDVLHVVFL